MDLLCWLGLLQWKLSSPLLSWYFKSVHALSQLLLHIFLVAVIVTWVVLTEISSFYETQKGRCLPPHLRTETDPVSKTLCCIVFRIPDEGQSPNPKYFWVLYTSGRAIAEAVSRWLPIAAARVRSRVWSSEICGGQSGAGAGFLRVLWFPLPFIPPNAPSSQSPGAGTIGQ
jgi:hypothetical protein